MHNTRTFTATATATAWLLAGLLPAGFAAAQTAAPQRGELLYSTHCIGCHSAQMHWRDNKKATDWPSLKEQVRSWQQRSMLGWGEEDIDEVARHHNDTIYRYRREGARVGRASPANDGPQS